MYWLDSVLGRCSVFTVYVQNNLSPTFREGRFSYQKKTMFKTLLLMIVLKK